LTELDQVPSNTRDTRVIFNSREEFKILWTYNITYVKRLSLEFKTIPLISGHKKCKLKVKFPYYITYFGKGVASIIVHLSTRLQISHWASVSASIAASLIVCVRERQTVVLLTFCLWDFGLTFRLH
jgi:hypothetical protein